mmetsp:Transcript_83011/g.115346  ORF Transcript_83011/g.115346 Transcript_83011/m.115346 type:complete len:82 (-) Transcript_83011:8-253(-)
MLELDLNAFIEQQNAAAKPTGGGFNDSHKSLSHDSHKSLSIPVSNEVKTMIDNFYEQSPLRSSKPTFKTSVNFPMMPPTTK